MAGPRAVVKIGLALTLCIAAAPPAGAAACAGPKALEATVHERPGAEAYTQVGLWFGDHRQFACAVENFRAALKYAPGSARLHYLVGLTLYTSGKADEAVAELQESIQLNAQNLDAHLILGAALTELNRNADAATQWEAALKIDPSSKPALDGLSRCLIAAGHYMAAIGILSSTPRDENMALDLAFAYGKAGNLEQARDVLVEALRATPSSLRLTNALVTVYVRQYRNDDAVKAAKACVDLRPNDAAAEALYVRVLVLDGRLDEAWPLARKLIAAAPMSFDSLYLNGILERESGEFAAARTHLEQAIALNPGSANAHYNLGVDLAELKDYPAAKVQLEKAIQLGVYQPTIRFELAKVLRNLGEAQEAQQQLQLYQKDEREQANRTLAASKSSQGDQEVAKGNFKQAAALYRDAVAAVPTNAYMQYKLALVLDTIGDITNERAALQQAVQIDSDFAPAQYQLGYLDSRGGDLSSAERQFRAALRSAPGYTKAWISLAATLAMESQFDEAQKAVNIALRLNPQDTEAQQLRHDLSAAQHQQ